MGARRPVRLAEGQTTGAPKARRTPRATGWSGIRRPMVLPPPVTVSETEGSRHSTSVSGPGKKSAISRRASGGTDRASVSTSAGVGDLHGQGLAEGPLLGVKDARDAVHDKGAGGQAVDGLRRVGDQAARPQDVPGAGQDVRVGGGGLMVRTSVIGLFRSFHRALVPLEGSQGEKFGRPIEDPSVTGQR